MALDANVERRRAVGMAGSAVAPRPARFLAL